MAVQRIWVPLYLLMLVQLAEDLGCIEEMLVVHDPSMPCQSSVRIIEAVDTHFLPFHARSGMLRAKAIQYPFIRKRTVRKACTAASGMTYVLS